MQEKKRAQRLDRGQRLLPATKVQAYGSKKAVKEVSPIYQSGYPSLRCNRLTSGPIPEAELYSDEPTSLIFATRRAQVIPPWL